jgi:hypothetical protein
MKKTEKLVVGILSLPANFGYQAMMRMVMQPA